MIEGIGVSEKADGGISFLMLGELLKLEKFPEALYLSKNCTEIQLININPEIEVDTKRFFEITGLGKISLDNAMVKSMGGDAKIIEYKKANQSIIVYKADGVTEDRTL